MTDFAIVAGKRDAPFAESIHAGLQSSQQRDVSIAESLPQHSDAYVVLLWSAALEAGHAIDVQALVGLWSDGRLLVVRRDTTPLPLGLRDLETMEPVATPADVCSAVARATQAVDVKFCAADPPEIETQKKPSTIAKFFAALAVACILLAGWYYYTAGERARIATLTATFEAAAEATEELNKAKQAELEAQKRAAEATAAEESATKSGDAAALKAAIDARQKAEADAAAQAEVVQQREADFRIRQDAARKAKVDAVKHAAAPEKAQMVAKAEAPKAAIAAKLEVPKAESSVPRALTRSEREAQRDAEAAAKAIGKPAEQVAALSPSGAAPSGAAPGAAAAPTAAAPAAKAGVSESEAMYQQALAMERDGKAADAVRIYRRAARAGHGKAAKRLGDIFDRGVPGVSRDYAESLQWYQTARELGETVEFASARGGGSSPAAAAPVREAPKAAPARDAPKAAAPASAPAPAATPLPSAAESGISFTVVVVVVVVALVLGIALWFRSRRLPTLVSPRPSSRAGAQIAVDTTTLFVSYSHKDKKRVEPIVLLMEEMGRRVWMDRTDITGQAGWAGQIVRAIRECRAVVLMASPNSFSSDQVVRELYLAMNHKKTIVPIEIEPAVLPDELQYILAPFQHHRLSGSETREVLGRALAAV